MGMQEDSLAIISNTLDEQLEEVMKALGCFLNAEFTKADAILQTKADLDYPYHNLGKSVLYFLKSMFTFDPVDILNTLEQLDKTIAIANSIRSSQKQSLYERISGLVISRAKPAESTEAYLKLIAHSELIISECNLLKSIISIASDNQEGFVSILRQSLHVNTSYGYYLRAYASSQNMDVHYKSGVLLGNGVFNLMFPLMPPKVSQVFSFFGYRGDTALGLKQLTESIDLGSGLRSPLSELVILIYHLIIASTLPTRERIADEKAKEEADWYSVCNKILAKSAINYANSPIYKYFLGRLLFVQGKLPEAISVFEDTMKQEIEWPHLRHAGYWEITLCSLYTLNWKRGYMYAEIMAKENMWSKAFYTYLQAIFLMSMGDEHIEEVKELMRKIPQLMKRVAGRSIPVEKFALQRANLILHHNRLPFHPALELALVWDGLQMISTGNRQLIEQMMIRGLPGIADAEKRCQILLTLSNLLRLKKSPDAALEYARSALYLKVPADGYCVPLAHLEIASAYLQLSKLPEAHEHYNQSIGYKHPYLVKKFMEIRLARFKIELDLAEK